MSLSRFALSGMLLVVGAMAASAQVKVAPIKFEERVLGNGMRVVSVRDTSSPTVSIHVLYMVGGKHDPIGRSGFAHMFEHMMFKSTKNMPNEKLDRLTEDVGGWNNASTREDFTNYYEVVPSNHLEVLLWAEADRMVNLNVDEKNFSSERDVVKEEYRQSVLSQPYGKLFYTLLNERNYLQHPYRRGVIGNLEELGAATPADAELFYRQFYRPDNATLIVVGDFDQSQFDGWVDKYFGGIKAPEGRLPAEPADEPERTEARRYEETAPNVPFPAVAISYLAPPSESDDIPALRVAETIMSGGASSRLYESLVRSQQVAQEAAFNADIRRQKGLLSLYAIASEGKTSPMLESALMAEITKMKNSPVSERELQKAKNLLISSEISYRETNDGKANAIEQALAYRGSVAAVNDSVVRIQNVTAADVMRVMNRYFNDSGRVVIHYNQAPTGGDR